MIVPTATVTKARRRALRDTAGAWAPMPASAIRSRMPRSGSTRQRLRFVITGCSDNQLPAIRCPVEASKQALLLCNGSRTGFVAVHRDAPKMMHGRLFSPNEGNPLPSRLNMGLPVTLKVFRRPRILSRGLRQ